VLPLQGLHQSFYVRVLLAKRLPIRQPRPPANDPQSKTPMQEGICFVMSSYHSATFVLPTHLRTIMVSSKSSEHAGGMILTSSLMVEV
jgi:hypothetical protein